MLEQSAKSEDRSINSHFRREAIIPVVLAGAVIALAALMAVVGPFLLSHWNAGLENSHKLADDGDRAAFISALKSADVPFRTPNDGSIWYPAAQEDRVDPLLKQVLTERSGGVFYPNPKDALAFKKELEAAHIPYSTRMRLGREWIIWDHRFNARAAEIQQDVEQRSISGRDR
jgi:hypothetical protein